MAAREEALEGAGALGTPARSEGQRSFVNVGQAERWASAIGGGALALYGLTRGSMGGVALALIGGSLIYRGASGHCTVYSAAGIDTSGAEGDNPNVSVRGGHGTKVEKSVTINRPPAELYSFWRNFENLPRFMNHLESVKVSGNDRSHWVAKGPAGTSVEWDAEVYNEKENELIAWRSLEGSEVANAGSVHFEKAAGGGRGTVVRVVLKYDPPAGKLGAAVAWLFGENPSQQIDEDLRRFKQLMETGETATTEGQTSGRAAKA
ncbi:MAG TPA: SRPBCC family protein [Pyrinomonadaceae bacterium]